MQHRRTGALGAALLVTLAACGSGSDEAASTASDEPPAATQAPATDDLAEAETAPDTATPPAEDGGEDASTTDAPVDEPVATEGEQPDASEAAPENDEEPEEPVATEAPEAAPPAEPVVGGRLFAADVQPEAQFDGNPFPDLVVDDVGKDAQVNIANILPSDRPVLLWAWAPH